MGALKNKSVWQNVALCALTLAFGWCFLYSQFWGWSSDVRIVLKGTAGVMFVLTCAWNVFALRRGRKIDKSCIFMLIGQVFACLGDIVLNYEFTAGAVLFAVGHIGFFISFCCLGGIRLRSAAFMASICVFSLAALQIIPGLVLDSMAPVIYSYAVIISCMLGMAVSLVFDGTLEKKHRILIFAGALAFYLSDFMLLICMFASGGKPFDIACLMLYYPAECLLALSAGYVKSKQSQ